MGRGRVGMGRELLVVVVVVGRAISCFYPREGVRRQRPMPPHNVDYPGHGCHNDFLVESG